MLAALLARGGKTSGIDTMAQRLFHTHHGNMLVSGLFGLALAVMFRKVCNDRKCVVLHAPPLDEIKNTVYELEDTCYKYTAKPVKCKS